MGLNEIDEKLASCVKQHQYLDEKLEVKDEKPWFFRLPQVITSVNKTIHEQQEASLSSQETLHRIKNNVHELKKRSDEKPRNLFVRAYVAAVRFFTGVDLLKVIEVKWSGLNKEIAAHTITKDSQFWDSKAVDLPKDSATADFPKSDEGIYQLDKSIKALRLKSHEDLDRLFWTEAVPDRMSFIYPTGDISSTRLVKPEHRFFVIQDRVTIDGNRVDTRFLSQLHIHSKAVTLKGSVDTEAVIQLFLRSKGVETIDLSEAQGLSADVLGLLGKLDGLKRIIFPERLEESQIPIDQLPQVNKSVAITSRLDKEDTDLTIYLTDDVEKEVLEKVFKVAPQIKRLNLTGSKLLSVEEVAPRFLHKDSSFWEPKGVDFPEASETQPLPIVRIPGQQPTVELRRLKETTKTLSLTPSQLPLLTELPIKQKQFLLETDKIKGIENPIGWTDRVFVKQESVEIDGDSVSKAFLSQLYVDAKTVKIGGRIDTESVVQLLLRSQGVEELDLSDTQGLSTAVLGLLGKLPIKKIHLPKALSPFIVPTDQVISTDRKAVITTDPSEKGDLVVVLHKEASETQLAAILAAAPQTWKADLSATTKLTTDVPLYLSRGNIIDVRYPTQLGNGTLRESDFPKASDPLQVRVLFGHPQLSKAGAIVYKGPPASAFLFLVPWHKKGYDLGQKVFGNLSIDPVSYHFWENSGTNFQFGIAKRLFLFNNQHINTSRYPHPDKESFSLGREFSFLATKEGFPSKEDSLRYLADPKTHPFERFIAASYLLTDPDVAFDEEGLRAVRAAVAPIAVQINGSQLELSRLGAFLLDPSIVDDVIQLGSAQDTQDAQLTPAAAKKLCDFLSLEWFPETAQDISELLAWKPVNLLPPFILQELKAKLLEHAAKTPNTSMKFAILITLKNYDMLQGSDSLSLRETVDSYLMKQHSINLNTLYERYINASTSKTILPLDYLSAFIIQNHIGKSFY